MDKEVVPNDGTAAPARSRIEANAELLPDSRLKTIHTPRGMVQSVGMGTWVPIYCANCGKDGGICPEENMTFLFYLCDDCAEKHGHIAGTLSMPDEVFWQKLIDEQLAQYGRYLTDQELAAVVEADAASPLAKLLKSRRST
jgi:hypothetical protein